jgi:hypothetical protein
MTKTPEAEEQFGSGGPVTEAHGWPRPSAMAGPPTQEFLLATLRVVSARHHLAAHEFDWLGSP